ncbi:MAG: purine-nucleoside phosphorylase [Armatimonadetes bacterium]|nr:purine-nucleoside phosphorylase [Armatimonadota bacterium]
MTDLRSGIQEAAAAIRRRTGLVPEIALILGSGLGALADEIAAEAALPYEAIPHFPRGSVEGHAGRLILGALEGKRVVAMQGRVHLYEGYTAVQVTLPVRVMRALGAGTLVASNAAGGINPQFRAGDLMLLTDHINFTGTNPLIGPHDPALGPRFPDMSRLYDAALGGLARRIAQEEGMTLRSGVYIAVAGPSYETPAEIEMFRRWGADAVGMSTVPEVIVARQMGMRVLAVSAITNVIGGIRAEPLTHEGVIAAAKELEPRFIRLVRRVVREMSLSG